MKLLRVSKDDLPIAKGTAYQWHTKGLHQRIVYKVAGVLMFDLEEFEALAKKVKAIRGEELGD